MSNNKSTFLNQQRQLYPPYGFLLELVEELQLGFLPLAVADDDEFPVLVSLVEDVVDDVTEEAFCFIAGEDDGKHYW